jgi:alpha-aminoadipate/glutamate carrier protein LysW
VSLETVTANAECPECYAEVALREVMQGEIVRCADCDADLEVRGLDPVELQLAPEEEEDWGE